MADPKGAKVIPALAVTEITVETPASFFTMGTDSGDPNEAPTHEVNPLAFGEDKIEDEPCSGHERLFIVLRPIPSKASRKLRRPL
jgi:hypothetical protein